MAKSQGNKFSDALKVKLKNGKLSLKGLLDDDNDVKLYQFKCNNRSSFNTALGRFKGNVELTLFNRKGKVVAISNEDDGKPEFIRERLKAGTYFLQIKRISGVIKYRLKTSVVELAGNNFSSALNIATDTDDEGGNLTYKGFVSSKDEDEAFYQFSLADRSTFFGLLQGLKADADIELYDSNRQVIFSSTAVGLTSELLGQVLDAGSYFLKVKVKSGSTKYDLKLNFKSFTTDLVNISDPARVITLGSSTTFSNQFVGSVALDDFYKVDVNTPSNLNLVLGDLQADANLQLLSSDGSILASSSNTGTAQDLLSSNLKAGTYYIRVLPGEGGLPTSYNLNVTLGALKLFGLTDGNRLLAFNPDKPAEAVGIDVTGLASGETLKGIDFRPANGAMYALSSASKLYTIDLATGAATFVGAADPALTGTAYGIDFNPTVDRLRVVSDVDENLRLVPTTGAIAATDVALAYATPDANASSNPNITAVAYDNNFVGATTTTLYGIDTTLDTLVRQGDLNGTPTSPNAGTLFTIGALGADFATEAGFDLFTDSSLTNTAYAVSGSTLYGINLTTGAATNLGTVSMTPATSTTSTGTTSPSTSPAPLNLIGLAGRV